MTAMFRRHSAWTRDRVRRKLAVGRGIDRLARHDKTHAARLRLALHSLEARAAHAELEVVDLDTELRALESQIAVSPAGIGAALISAYA